MIDLEKLIKDNFKYNCGAFYGHVAGLDLGVGLIYDNIPFAVFDKDEKLYDTASGLVYILSHECDVDQNNPRFFNDYILTCPIIDMAIFVEDFEAAFPDKLTQMVVDLVGDRIFRAIYIPPINRSVLPFGGILYFNQIGNTHVSCFGEATTQPIYALSHYAQRIIDFKLENHLLRPKAQSLPLRGSAIGSGRSIVQ
jgi:hypothetical protein